MENNSRVDGAFSLGRGEISANQSSRPRGLCQHINLLIRKFWWGSTTNGRRKTNWVAWEKLIQPKFMGRLGFRDRAIQFGFARTSSMANFTEPHGDDCTIIKSCLLPSL